MKLKNQFLSLSAVLALGMMATTTAWAQNTPEGYTSATVQLQGNAETGYFINLPKPSENSGTKLWAYLEIPSYVKSFHIYDDGGKDGKFTSTACETANCGVYLALRVPEGRVFNMGGTLQSYEIGKEESGDKAVVWVNNGSSYNNSNDVMVIYGSGVEQWSKRKSSGREIVLEFHTTTPRNSDNAAGLDLDVDVLVPNMNVTQAGTTNDSYTVEAVANQFNYQVLKNVSGIDNTTTLTAPEGYVIYLEGGATIYANATVAVYDGANINASKLLEKTGASTTENAITSGNTITFHATTVNGGMEETMRLPVHIVKKNSSLSTAGVDIYEDYQKSYKVAKISDIAIGTVSIPGPVNVDAIIYERTFVQGVGSSIVLPFELPEGTTTNAKFYYLQQVVQKQDVCAWKATLKWIGEKAVPSANKPYAVVVQDGSQLKFNLNKKEATVGTATIVDQLDETGNWIFRGTYEYRAWNAGDEEIGLTYALAKEGGNGYTPGQFVKVGAGSSVAPMRAYMRKVNANVRLRNLSRPLAKGEVSSIEDLPESIDVEFVDEGDKPMAIGRMNTVTGAIQINRWIDLKGRSTNHKPTTKGVFFNKKGIVK